MRFLLTAALLLVATVSVRAETPGDFQNLFAVQAKQENPAFSSFSAEQGQRFYASTHGKEWSCATCVFGARPLKRAIQEHIENPLAKRILEGQFAAKDTIKVDCIDRKITFVKA